MERKGSDGTSDVLERKAPAARDDLLTHPIGTKIDSRIIWAVSRNMDVEDVSTSPAVGA
ncbi:hypothetical protein GCM10022294_35670 [Dietzia aurantiaca]